ncbi:MAG TPA: DUF1844 domain-containing protein [Candidatus Polarisedimenticolia bacterium]|nr:DUF1844 domain-containing protein [Candidatus Polarisedimenticolia bacterium]
MSDDNKAGASSGPVRVIDRRSFASDGTRREPDAAVEESPVAAPAMPAHPAAAKGATKAAGAAAPAASPLFQNLVVNLARQAAANLGASRHPLTGQIEVDLDGAQQMIELIEALRLKTHGNLTAEEADLIEGLIGDLQMQYVAVRSKSSGRP